jgi:DNA-binding Xre family transcriptional regulator
MKQRLLGISYKPLFVMLAQYGMKKADLCENWVYSPTPLAKFAKNEHVSGETLEKICAYFKSILGYCGLCTRKPQKAAHKNS